MGQQSVGRQRLRIDLGAGFLLGAIALVMALGLMLGASGAIASPAPPETIAVHLGTAAGDLRFEPSQLSFRAGQRYRLVLDNPSPERHYFTAKDFADGLWTQKVQAGDVEVKGAIHELELKPGAIAEWVFVPERPGVYELHCAIAGHAEAGMVGQIEIVAAG
ncbi:plastocyanin/azurin family copper-binding protein [Leptolyngbya sp. CCNP1308]|uniref:plastocyanin/azurin family copper-binding protein n=1 Tax=Leptolyngbya sp. CCNP1308 TaxID=3110255 RepID=UPI002B21967F|nr:plastocyanin/azurin family copper-binding protein [Leptolyngbya sp. CCNP1308]MEA5450537.1 plastocyanin/azurin family copper-binding protein [Leptolyngbya sp. CCNP1308]